MADIPNNTAENQPTGFPPVPEDSSGESFDSQTASEGESTGDDSAGADAGDDSSSDSDDESDEDDSEFEDDGAEPEVREKDKSYYIGLRHGKKAAKQAAPKDESDDGDADDSDSDDEDLDDEEIDAFNQSVQEAVSPLVERLTKEDNQRELRDFVSENPEFKPYQSKIERYMNHKTRQHLPLTTIAMEAVGPQGMMKIGAKMARQSDQKKSGSRVDTGGGKRGVPEGKSVNDMTNEEFAQYQNQIRQQS